jgi:hypothetical protein
LGNAAGVDNSPLTPADTEANVLDEVAKELGSPAGQGGNGAAHTQAEDALAGDTPQPGTALEPREPAGGASGTEGWAADDQDQSPENACPNPWPPMVYVEKKELTGLGACTGSIENACTGDLPDRQKKRFKKPVQANLYDERLWRQSVGQPPLPRGFTCVSHLKAEMKIVRVVDKMPVVQFELVTGWQIQASTGCETCDRRFRPVVGFISPRAFALTISPPSLTLRTVINIVLPSIPCPHCSGSGQTLDYIAIGALIRTARESAGVSLRCLASEARLSAAFWSDLERGHRGVERWTEEKVAETLAMIERLRIRSITRH